MEALHWCLPRRKRRAFLAWPFFLRSDSDDKDDPHKALGNIVLDDFLDPLPVKVSDIEKRILFLTSFMCRRRGQRRS